MNEYEFRKYTDIAERFHVLGVIDNYDVEWLLQQVESMRLRLQQDNPAIGGPKQSTCNIAHENTGGTYYCTRQAGHSGPCAAHPKTIMSFIREEN